MNFWLILKYKIKTFILKPQNILLLIILLSSSLVVSIYGKDRYNVVDSKIPVVLIDRDNSVYSTDIIRGVRQSNSVRLVRREEKEAMRLLSIGTVEAVCILTRGLGESLEKGEIEDLVEIYQSPESTASGVVSETVCSTVINAWMTNKSKKSILREYDKRELLKNSEDIKRLEHEIVLHTARLVKNTPIIGVTHKTYTKAIPVDADGISVSDHSKNDKKGVYIRFMSFQSIFILPVCLFFSTWIFGEIKTGLLKRIKGAGRSLTGYIITSNLAVSLCIWSTGMLSLLYLGYKTGLNAVTITGSLTLILCYAFLSSSAGLWLSIVSGSVYRLLAVLPLIILLNTVLSGILVEVSLLGPLFSKLSEITPSFIAINTVKEYYIANSSIWKSSGIFTFTAFSLNVLAAAWLKK